MAEFCRERGIAASKLYSWKQRCVGAKAASGFVRLRVAPAVETETVSTARSGIEVRLAGGRSFVVEPGFDASHLRALLAVLEMGHLGLPSLRTLDGLQTTRIWPVVERRNALRV